MKILVTGGSGYLGRHVRTFFEADDFSRRSYLDILNTHDASLVADYDVVIHLAAHLDKDPNAAESCFQTNVEGTQNLLRNMSANSVFIFASTKDVYGGFADEHDEVPESCRTDYCGQTALEWSKLIAERFVEYWARARNFRACIFRLGSTYARLSEDNEYGWVTNYVESVKNRLPIRLPISGSPVRDILHVDDFSRACRAFIDSPIRSGLYNLGGGKRNSASLREIVETIGSMIEIEPIVDCDPSIPVPIPMIYVSDNKRVRDELGWEPLIGIEDGLKSIM